MPRPGTRFAIGVATLLVLVLGACSDDEPPLIPPEDPERETAATAGEAMGQFLDIYSSRDVDFYADLLSVDFQFVNSDGAVDDHTAEMAIATKMFTEVAGENGVVIGEITIDHLQAQGAWSQTPTNDPNFGGFPESLYRPYFVDLKFRIAGMNLILRVQGPVVFYVLDEGDGGSDFRILGIDDQTFGNKATEDRGWTAVRRLFD